MIASLAQKLFEVNTAVAAQSEGNLAPTPLPRLEFNQASVWNDAHGAFRLLYRNYLDKGLISPNPAELRYTHYNLLPETATFLAKAQNDVIATFSMIPDSTVFDLPMEELYGDECAALRDEGRKLGEISGLAVDPRFRPITIHLLLNLIKMLYTYANKLEITDLVVACHPKHARLYKRMFRFEEVGDLRTYKAVNDAPAVAVRLDLTTVETVYRESFDVAGFNLYRFFFSDEIFRCPNEALRVGAFPHDVNRKLCTIQPHVRSSLEAKAPELLHELTGWPIRETLSGRSKSFQIPAGFGAPVFVPA